MRAIQAMFLAVLLVLHIGLGRASEPLIKTPEEWLDFKANITVDGRLVSALEKAIATMRTYKLLSPIGRRMDSYEISVALDSKQEIATFLFSPKLRSLSDDMRLKGAFEIQVDIRMKDLKMLERRIYN